jgi:transposase InsO family protein
VALDLIGPWKVKLNNESFNFYALTIIDHVSNFPDLIRMHNKTAGHVGLQFENLWLSQYPRPIRCIHDWGTEFMGVDFRRVLQCFGIKDVPTSICNAQSNSICECLHQLVGNALRIYLSQDATFTLPSLLIVLLQRLSMQLAAQFIAL